MFQNIKSDIIYYKTNTDFELEFNLCGCCRMRLLTDKAPDRKTMVHSLARAVSRSRIIIVIGSLFGEEGVLNIVANAIGSTLVAADNKAYGIESNEEIEIIKGATPLVTPEGYFGGCIIESGPQTMILLSDSKSIRKTIMTNLIHPYIEELYALESQEKEIPEVQETAEAPEAEDIPETQEQTEVQEVTEPADLTEENEELISDNTEIAEEVTAENTEETVEQEIQPAEEHNENESEEDEDISFEAESQDEPEEQTPRFNRYPSRKRQTYLFTEDLGEDDEDYDDPYSFEDDIRSKSPRKGLTLKPVMLAVMIILLITLAVLCYCIFYVPSREGVTATAYLQEIYNTLFG